MTTQNAASKNESLTVYAQSTSLLFQFILSEFIQAYEGIQQIENLYSKIECLLIQKRLSVNVEDQLNDLLNLFPQLIGADHATNNEPIFPWTHQKGSLNKLRYYVYLLSQKHLDEKNIQDLNIAVSKAFHSSLQVKEVIFSLKRHCEDGERIPNFVSLYQILDRVMDNMKRASRLVLKVLVSFKEDENVLLYLIEHHQQLDALYQTQFVTKVLQKMFPKGVEKAEQHLKAKYLERGFKNLSESITQKMLQLKQTSLC